MTFYENVLRMRKFGRSLRRRPPAIRPVQPKEPKLKASAKKPAKKDVIADDRGESR